MLLYRPLLLLLDVPWVLYNLPIYSSLQSNVFSIMLVNNKRLHGFCVLVSCTTLLFSILLFLIKFSQSGVVLFPPEWFCVNI